jgi:hypothetical protein
MSHEPPEAFDDYELRQEIDRQDKVIGELKDVLAAKQPGFDQYYYRLFREQRVAKEAAEAEVLTLKAALGEAVKALKYADKRLCKCTPCLTFFTIEDREIICEAIAKLDAGSKMTEARK